mgnify:CR=1 FL=1
MGKLIDFLSDGECSQFDPYSKEQHEKAIKMLDEVWADQRARRHVRSLGIHKTEVYCNKKGVIDFYEAVKERPLTDEEKSTIEEGTYKFVDFLPVKQ